MKIEKNAIQKLIEKKVEEQQYKLLEKCKENEDVVLLPVKITYDKEGLLSKISIVNTKPYFDINGIVAKECCSICGQIVDSELFISNGNGQKTHIDCFKKDKK